MKVANSLYVRPRRIERGLAALLVVGATLYGGTAFAASTPTAASADKPTEGWVFTPSPVCNPNALLNYTIRATTEITRQGVVRDAEHVVTCDIDPPSREPLRQAIGDVPADTPIYFVAGAYSTQRGMMPRSDAVNVLLSAQGVPSGVYVGQDGAAVPIGVANVRLNGDGAATIAQILANPVIQPPPVAAEPALPAVVAEPSVPVAEAEPASLAVVANVSPNDLTSRSMDPAGLAPAATNTVISTPVNAIPLRHGHKALRFAERKTAAPYQIFQMQQQADGKAGIATVALPATTKNKSPVAVIYVQKRLFGTVGRLLAIVPKGTSPEVIAELRDKGEKGYLKLAAENNLGLPAMTTRLNVAYDYDGSLRSSLRNVGYTGDAKSIVSQKAMARADGAIQHISRLATGFAQAGHSLCKRGINSCRDAAQNIGVAVSHFHQAGRDMCAQAVGRVAAGCDRASFVAAFHVARLAADNPILRRSIGDHAVNHMMVMRAKLRVQPNPLASPALV